MSLPDATMWDYYKLLLGTGDKEIEKLKTEHPMAVKKSLGFCISQSILFRRNSQKRAGELRASFFQRRSA